MPPPPPKPATVAAACAAERNTDPSNPRHVLRQLEAEGEKRIESFLFERLLSRMLRFCLSPDQLAEGWVFQLGPDNAPQHWFRLVTHSDRWNAADDEVLRMVLANECSATRVTFAFPTREFFGSRYTGTAWAPPEPLHAVFKSLVSGPRGRPRNYSDIDRQRQELALKFIEEEFSRDELEQLSLTRRFINCHLVPWFAKQPMDIDACVLGNDALYFIEFKRKYPARNNRFGIDQDPHVRLIRWLEGTHARFLHLILVDPLWEKTKSPIHLLQQDSTSAPFAIWLGAVLDTSAFTADSLHTTGTDSGMTGGRRTQSQFPVHAMHEIGTGLEPRNFCRFLENPDDFSAPATLENLTNARDAARRASDGQD